MGRVSSNLRDVRRLKAKMGQDNFTLLFPDGSSETFGPDDCIANFLRNAERLKALHRGEEIPAPHPLAQALLRGVNLNAEQLEAAESQRRLDAQISQESSVIGD